MVPFVPYLLELFVVSSAILSSEVFRLVNYVVCDIGIAFQFLRNSQNLEMLYFDGGIYIRVLRRRNGVEMQRAANRVCNPV